MTNLQLIVRYSAFSVMATIANLATQRAVFATIQNDYSFALAVFFGTATGLILKYIVDKRWIFFDTSSGLATHGKKLTLYTLMGVVTTMVFWGTETAFWLTWKTDQMREIGAILGLTVGYVIKYKLDRRFVFNDQEQEEV